MAWSARHRRRERVTAMQSRLFPPPTAKDLFALESANATAQIGLAAFPQTCLLTFPGSEFTFLIDNANCNIQVPLPPQSGPSGLYPSFSTAKNGERSGWNGRCPFQPLLSPF